VEEYQKKITLNNNRMKFKSLLKESILEEAEMSDSDSSSSSDEYGGRMLRSQLQKIIMCSQKIHDYMHNHDKIDPWVEDHIARAMELVSQVSGYIIGLEDEDSEEEVDQNHMIVSMAERHLTKKEKAKEEEIIKSIKKKKGGKSKLGPKDYAIATAQAKKLSENK
jgi:hypothetical protein